MYLVQLHSIDYKNDTQKGSLKGCFTYCIHMLSWELMGLGAWVGYFLRFICICMFHLVSQLFMLSIIEEQ